MFPCVYSPRRVGKQTDSLHLVTCWWLGGKKWETNLKGGHLENTNCKVNEWVTAKWQRGIIQHCEHNLLAEYLLVPAGSSRGKH